MGLQGDGTKVRYLIFDAVQNGGENVGLSAGGGGGGIRRDNDNAIQEISGAKMREVSDLRTTDWRGSEEVAAVAQRRCSHYTLGAVTPAAPLRLTVAPQNEGFGCNGGWAAGSRLRLCDRSGVCGTSSALLRVQSTPSLCRWDASGGATVRSNGWAGADAPTQPKHHMPTLDGLAGEGDSSSRTPVTEGGEGADCESPFQLTPVPTPTIPAPTQ